MSAELIPPVDAGAPAAEGVVIRPLRQADLSACVDIFLQNFPERAERWFDTTAAAARIYADLFDLVRALHPGGSVGAWIGQNLVGYAMLTVPEASITVSLIRNSTGRRMLRRLATGAYRPSLAFFTYAARSLLSRDRGASDARTTGMAHLYVIALSSGATGRGVGSRLLEAVCTAAAATHPGIWLNVDLHNAGAIRFYEKHGFHPLGTAGDQLAMMRAFAVGVS